VSNEAICIPRERRNSAVSPGGHAQNTFEQRPASLQQDWLCTASLQQEWLSVGMRVDIPKQLITSMLVEESEVNQPCNIPNISKHDTLEEP